MKLNAVIRPHDKDKARAFLERATQPDVTQEEFSRLYAEALRAQPFTFVGLTNDGRTVVDHDGVKIGAVTPLDFMVDYDQLLAAWHGAKR